MEIRTKHASYRFIPQLGILVNSQLKDDFNHLIPDMPDEGKVIANLAKELSDEEIEERFVSIRDMTLNITEGCNFRCRYCAYSGLYETGRTHSEKKMSFETACKMVEHLIGWVTSKRRKTKTKSINIGIYGGEPLLEFGLIKDIIEYTRRRFREKQIHDKFDVGFRLNTNGYLLNDEIVDFMVKENMIIDISLDGPAGEHDKFRVTKNGDSTWNVIWSNLERIKKRYPGYWENVRFLITLHPFHCCEKIDRFFLDNKDYFDLEHVNAYFVNMLFLKEDIKEKLKGKGKNQRSIINLLKASERLDDRLRMKDLTPDTQFTSMCFPGEAKLFVASDGTIHICEKIKPDLPIGNVDKGIDFDALRRILREWNEQIIRNRCWECIAWSFCTVCLAQSETKEGISINCKYKDNVEKILYEYLCLKEEEEANKGIDKYVRANSIRDYIRELE